MAGAEGLEPTRCGLAQIAALKRHWRFIHYRDQFESFLYMPNEKPPGRVAFHLAGAVRLELTRTVLETAMLPLHHAPKSATERV